MVSDVTLCPAVCRFSNLLITVLLLNMKCQLTKGDFIAKKMKTRDINVMPSFNDFTVVNTAAGNSCCCMVCSHWSPVLLSVGTGTVPTPAKEICQDARLYYLQLN